MEKEIFSQFQMNDLKGSDISSSDLEAVRKEEQKMKRESTLLSGVGLVTLITGVAIFALVNFALPIGFMDLLPILTGLGIAGSIFGFIRIMRRVFKGKTLDLPSLKIKRKSMSGVMESSSEKPFTETTYIPKKLGKSIRSKVFAGVAGGMAEYAGISPILMRMIFIFALFFSGGFATLAYLILAIFMPTNREPEAPSKLRSYN